MRSQSTDPELSKANYLFNQANQELPRDLQHTGRGEDKKAAQGSRRRAQPSPVLGLSPII
jgi:hypothetical protein